jgi:hypothetical protein
MALGLNYNTGGGDNGDIVPFVKYDARAGRFFRNDRTEQNGAYNNNAVDITSNFKAVMDFENLEVGFLLFAAGSAPAFMLVKLGGPMPHKPADGKWKQGVRVMMKLHASCGGDVRETSSNAAAFLKGIDELHTLYEAGKAVNPGKLPIVILKTTIPVTSGSGDKKSTNYPPVFEITGWAPRPNDLVHVAKSKGGVAQTASPSTVPAAAPSTGSTQVSAPAAKHLETAGADDFG